MTSWDASTSLSGCVRRDGMEPRGVCVAPGCLVGAWEVPQGSWASPVAVSYDSHGTFPSVVTGGGGLHSILGVWRVVNPVLSLPGFESTLLLSYTPVRSILQVGKERGITSSHPHPSQEVPVAGADRWFKLEPRSSASRVQGDCHLVLKLITTQVRSHGEPHLHPCLQGSGRADDRPRVLPCRGTLL